MPDFAGLVPATRGLIAAPWTPASLSLLPAKRSVEIKPRGRANDPKGIGKKDEHRLGSPTPLTASRRTQAMLEAIVVRLEGA